MENMQNLINLDYLEKALKVIKLYADDTVDLSASKLKSSIDTAVSATKSRETVINNNITNLNNKIKALEERNDCECEPVDDDDFNQMLDKAFVSEILGTELIDPSIIISNTNLEINTSDNGDGFEERIGGSLKVNVIIPESFDFSVFENPRFIIFQNYEPTNTSISETSIEDEDLKIGSTKITPIVKDLVPQQAGISYRSDIAGNQWKGLVCRTCFAGSYLGKEFSVYGPVSRASYVELFKQQHPEMLDKDGFCLKESNFVGTKLEMTFAIGSYDVENPYAITYGILFSKSNSNLTEEELILEKADGIEIVKTANNSNLFSSFYTEVKETLEEINSDCCARGYMEFKDPDSGIVKKVIYTDIVRKS